MPKKHMKTYSMSLDKGKQNCGDMTPHTHEDGCYLKEKITSIGEEVVKLEILYTVGGM